MKFRKITALLLVLCMMLSLSISAFAADDVVASGTIQNSGIRWELNGNGWLTISGSGEAPVFQSADDQPWREYRDQITEVWYDDMEALTISDLAYWFEGCTSLTTAELPLAPSIGKHAFYNCPKLNTITMYYGETVLESIGEDAFWRETDSGDTLTIYYILGYRGVAKLGVDALILKTKGFDCKDIAVLYHTSSNNVGAWISRAAKKLRSDPDFLDAFDIAC